jgi:hypothetical protein
LYVFVIHSHCQESQGSLLVQYHLDHYPHLELHCHPHHCLQPENDFQGDLLWDIYCICVIHPSYKFSVWKTSFRSCSMWHMWHSLTVVPIGTSVFVYKLSGLDIVCQIFHYNPSEKITAYLRVLIMQQIKSI